MTRRRSALWLAVLLAVALVTSACGGSPGTGASETGGSEGGGPVASQTLRVGMDGDAGTLDPRLAQDTTAYRIDNLLYDGLVQLDAKFQPQPDLATSWENPDPKTWIFHLRDDAKFWDGTPVTADDVAYTFKTILDPNFKAPYRSLYTPVQEVTAVDPHTVKFTLSQPYAALLAYLDMGVVPKHVAEQAGNDLSSHPMGSGPYKFVQWDKNSKIVVEANPDYFGGAPKIQNIEFKIVADNTARAQALEAGDLDLIQSPLSPQDVQRLEGESDKFASFTSTAPGITYFNFNTQDPILKDMRVRQAIAMLIDQQTILKQIYQGIDKPATSILLPTSWAFTDAVKQPTFDEKAADTLLAQAGWKDTNGDGVLDKDGKKLSITLSTQSEDAERTQTVEFVQNTLQQHGFEVKTSISDWPSFIANVLDHKHQIALLGWLNLVDPDRAMYSQFHTGAGSNWGGYSNADVDRYLDQARMAADQAGRVQAYQAAAGIIAKELPYYVLTYQGFQVFYNPALKGFTPNTRGYFRDLANATFGK